MSIPAAEFINALLSSDPIGDRFRGKTVIGEVNLVKVPVQPVALKEVTFAGLVRIADLTMTNSVSLDECHFDLGLEIDGVTIDGSLSIEGASAHHLHLTHVRVSRDFNANKLISDNKLALQMCYIGGAFRMSGVTIRGEFKCETTEVAGGLYCWSVPGEKLDPPILDSVWFGNCTIRGSAYFDSSVISKTLILQNTRISGELRCCCIDRPLETRPVVTGGVELTDSTIEGTVIFDLLKAKSIKIRNGTINGDLRCGIPADCPLPKDEKKKQAEFFPKLDDELWIENTDIRGHCYFRGINVKRLRVTNSEIGCDFACGEYDKILAALIDNFLFYNVNLGGDLDLWSVKVSEILEITNAEIKGSVHCQCTNNGSAEGGRVIFRGARVEGFTSFVGSCFRDIEVEHGRFGGGLDFGKSPRLRKPPEIPEKERKEPGATQLNMLKLVHCQVDGKLDLSGISSQAQFVFDEVTFKDLELATPSYVEAISNAPKKSSYLFLESFLRTKGEDKDADAVYCAMRKKWKSEKILNPIRWLHWLTGYGTISRRLGAYLIVSFLILWGLFSNEKSVRSSLTPSVWEMEFTPKLAEKEYHPKKTDWSWGEGVFVALRVTLPVFDSLAGSGWEPSSEPVYSQLRWLTYERLAGHVRYFNFLALPLFVVGLSGLLKKRGE